MSNVGFWLTGVGCEEIMIAFEECHAQGFIWKSLGMCNDAKRALSNCLRAERLKRQDINRSDSQNKNAHIRAVWKEMDENK